MKTSLSLVVCLGAASALVGCGSDSGPAGAGSAGMSETAGSGPSSSAGTSSAGSSAETAGSSTGGRAHGSAGAPGSAGSDSHAGSGGSEPSATAGSGGEGGAPAPTVAWYECQASDQAFVRRAILGILGRHAVGQAEVNVYTDLIAQIDALDGYDPSAPITAPQSQLRHGRQVVVDALLANPDYESNWDALYRDFIRLQRVDEQLNGACDSIRARPTDAPAAAAWIRDKPATNGGDGKAPPTFADVIAGSIELDDITPIYTANLFSMITKTYDGANALPVALELSRRTDFGAWFDSAYLNRDQTCLGCHNSEFSVTFSADASKNRWFPVPGLFEKALFGSSTGGATVGGFTGADREHAVLRYSQMLNINPAKDQTDCAAASASVIAAAKTAGTLPNCASGDGVFQCMSDGALLCASTAKRQRLVQPWGMATGCGQFVSPQNLPIDQAYVESKLGNITGFRASMWDVTASLRAGFDKLEVEGLGADAKGNIADPDKAFAYLVSMNIVEKVWKEITGTPLTIANYYPRNAAERDQLQSLTEALIKSGYSNKALLSAIFASPYLNLAAPEQGCGSAPYGAPRIFDPWRMAEPDPSAQGNSMTDGIQPLSARTQARAAYAAIGWPLAAYQSNFPVTPKAKSGNLPVSEPPIVVGNTDTGTIELQFQTETGYYLKSSQPGARGLDFQGRLGWEDRFALCQKLPTNTKPDLIDGLAKKAAIGGSGTVSDFLMVLKDRIVGDSSLADPSEVKALQAIFGASLDAQASTVPDFGNSLRRVCGALLATPQFLLTGLQAKDGKSVPRLTPETASYDAWCEQVATLPLPGKLNVTCTIGQPLTVSVTP